MNKLIKEIEQVEDMNSLETKNEEQYEIGSWQTSKCQVLPLNYHQLTIDGLLFTLPELTPIIKLHFTRRNLLVGIGPFKQNWAWMLN